MRRALALLAVSLALAVFVFAGASGKKSIVRISFIKSGGFAGPMTRVQGTVDIADGVSQVSGDAAYHRKLDCSETAMLRAGAEPAALSQAAAQLAEAQAAGRGMGDADHYTVNVTASDGKSQEVTFNNPGSADGLKGVSPSTAKFLAWLQDEAQSILSEKMKAK